MRSAFYFLAVLVGGLAVAALVLSKARVEPSRSAARSTQTVFVDLDRLTTLHPSFAALVEIKALTARPGRQIRTSAPPACKPEKPFADPVRPPEVSRPEIEAELAQSAVGAFSRLETSQRQALLARLRAVRATMLESAKPELAAKIRQIEREAELKQRSLVTQLGEMRLSAAIRASVLGTIISGLESVLPRDVEEEERDPNGVLASQWARLKATQLELQRIDRTLTSEMAAIRAEAQEKIDKLRADTAAEVSARLSARENAERGKIETSIATARNEVFTELGMPEGLAGFEQVDTASPAGGRRTPFATITPARPAAAGIRTGASISRRQIAASLEAHLISDVARVAKQVAAERGIRLTFVRDESVPDATRIFARLLRQRAVWGPVLAAGGV